MDRERFEKLLADYLSGELSTPEQRELMRFVEANPEARAELAAYEQQEEHLTRYYRLKGERAAATGPEWLAQAQPAARPVARPWLRVALVAAALAVIALGVQVQRLYRSAVPTGDAALATVSSIGAGAFVLDGDKVTALAANMPVRQAQRISVPDGSYLALTLNDGNVVEARGGTQFTMEDVPDKLTFVLNRGQMWAHLKHKPLPKQFVMQTDRLRATATGTVFGVDDGLGGTIVSVAEGSVRVDCNGMTMMLEAGQSWNSRTGAPDTIPAESIDWSRMKENLESLAPKAKAAAAAEPALTIHESAQTTPTAPVAEIEDLIDLLPTRTTMFLDLRNLSGIVNQFNSSAYAMLWREQALKKWWSSIHGTELTDSITTQTHLREVMSIVRHLGGQCVVGVDSPDFIVLADCGANEEETARLLGTIVMDMAGGKFEQAQKIREYAQVAAKRLIVSSNPALTREVITRIAAGKGSGFAAADFNKKVRAAVGSKPQLVMAANIAPWMERWRKQDANLARRLDFTGLSGLENLIIAPGFTGGGGNQAARLGFVNERYGMANWLAEPAPMRGFNFFTADVHLFASAVIRSPRTMFFDWLNYLIGEQTTRQQEEARAFFETHNALFDAVGNEIAVGIDNPILPIPNVKVAIELARPSDFAREFDLLVDDFVERANAGKDVPVAERQEKQYQEFTIHTLHVDSWWWEPSWAYVDDYVVIGPGKTFVERSIDTWRSGVSIAHDQRLLRLLPAGASANVSLLVYQDVAKAIPVLLSTKLAAGMSAEQKKLIPDLGFMERFRAAGIAYAIARKQSIDLYFNTPSGIDFNLGMAAPMVANWLVPMGISERIDLYAQAEVALEDVAKAALDFQTKNGRLPSTMDELVSGGFIASKPVDPFDKLGKAQLKLIAGPAQGSIIIYSIGPDGVDDQGVLAADPTKGGSEGDVSIILPTLDGGPPKVRRPEGAPQNTTQAPAQQ
ncbi:FecR domain-containing protein [bacterium]|nr:FecR domain-containing protein [bacterium]